MSRERERERETEERLTPNPDGSLRINFLEPQSCFSSPEQKVPLMVHDLRQERSEVKVKMTLIYLQEQKDTCNHNSLNLTNLPQNSVNRNYVWSHSSKYHTRKEFTDSRTILTDNNSL